jgi:drug/metabolite transporter (DMT)-like permease
VALGAVFLAAHFMLWVKAFELTDFASNLLLLVMQPVTAAVIGHWLGERAHRATWISVALALIGLGIVTGGDFARGPRALLGDAMCLAAGLAITIFFALTREVRRALPLSAFMGITLGVGAICTLPIALLAGVPLHGYSTSTWEWLAALVVLTTVGGHGCFNIAARHTRLFTVNVVVVLEPAIAIAMGAFMFGASITPLQLGGGVVLAVAVVVGLLPELHSNHEPTVLPAE